MISQRYLRLARDSPKNRLLCSIKASVPRMIQNLLTIFILVPHFPPTQVLFTIRSISVIFHHCFTVLLQPAEYKSLVYFRRAMMLYNYHNDSKSLDMLSSGPCSTCLTRARIPSKSTSYLRTRRHLTYTRTLGTNPA